MTLREWFDEFTRETEEIPEAVVFGFEGLYGRRLDEWRVALETAGLGPGETMSYAYIPDDLLDREFGDSFGTNESPDLCAWSDSWVLFSDNYDGSESLRWVPRHPRDHTPIRPGGG